MQGSLEGFLGVPAPLTRRERPYTGKKGKGRVRWPGRHEARRRKVRREMQAESRRRNQARARRKHNGPRQRNHRRPR